MKTLFFAVLLTLLGLLCLPCKVGAQDLVAVSQSTQPKMVKIYGAGGTRGLEAFQSGMLVSADGYVLTVWSYVLDTDPILVVLGDGSKQEATLKGYDPRLQIALLKTEGTDLEHFNLDDTTELNSGQRVLAFSNLFNVASGDEPQSLLHGIVSAKTKLNARRGAFKSPYSGEVYVLDAMTNNPGSAGGALTDSRGKLAGLLGKELRSSEHNIWLNYAIPISEMKRSIEEILSGKFSPRKIDEAARKPIDPLTLELLGVELVPNVLSNTPPFIDRIKEESIAFQAGLKSDDLILFVNNRVVRSCDELKEEVSFVERRGKLEIAIRRGTEIKAFTLQLK